MSSQIFEIENENHQVAMVLGSAFCRSVNQPLTQVMRKCSNSGDSKEKTIQGLKNKIRDQFQMPVAGKKFRVKIQSPQEVTYPDFINAAALIQDAVVSDALPNMVWIHWDMASFPSQIHLLNRYIDDSIKQFPQEFPVAVIVKVNSVESKTENNQLLILERHVNNTIPVMFFDENQMKFLNLKPRAVAWKKNRIEKLIVATLSYALIEKLLSEIDSLASRETTLNMDINSIRHLFTKEFND